MEIVFDKKRILDDAGLEFSSDSDCLHYIKELVYYLMTHNKNYRQEQEFAINDINVILDNLTIKKD